MHQDHELLTTSLHDHEPSALAAELASLESETFQIADYAESQDLFLISCGAACSCVSSCIS